MKPGGLAVLSVYNHSLMKIVSGGLGLTSAGKKEGYHSDGRIRYYNFGKEELTTWLSKAFRVLKVRGSDHSVPLLNRIHPKVTVFLDRLLGRSFLSIPVFAREMTALCVKED